MLEDMTTLFILLLRASVSYCSGSYGMYYKMGSSTCVCVGCVRVHVHVRVHVYVQCVHASVCACALGIVHVNRLVS